MGLLVLIIGLAVFIGSHVFVTMRAHRAALIARVGEWPYKGLFSVVSIIAIFLIGWGFNEYRHIGYIAVWNPPAWTRHIVEALDVAGLDLPRRRLHPRQHQAQTQASDAGRGENLGIRASVRQRRPRLDHPVRLDPGLGRV